MLLYGRELTGVNCGELYMSYKSIFQDLRDAVDIVHANVSSRLMSNATRRNPVILWHVNVIL